MALYLIKKEDYQEKSIHNVCREVFNSHENPVKSLELVDFATGNLFYLVLSGDDSKKYNTIKIPAYKNGDIVSIVTAISLDYRRENQRNKTFSSRDEVLGVFESKTGLKKTSDVFIEKISKDLSFNRGSKNFGSKKSYQIIGEFRVENEDLFNEALKNGVGTRGSYGFGVVLVTEQLLDVA